MKTLKLKDGTIMKRACSSPNEYGRIYAYMVKHHLDPDTAFNEYRGKFGSEENDDEKKKERRLNVYIRNLQTQMDVCFNQFCRLDELANQDGDPLGMLIKLRKEIRQTVMTLINIGETNMN